MQSFKYKQTYFLSSRIFLQHVSPPLFWSNVTVCKLLSIVGISLVVIFRIIIVQRYVIKVLTEPCFWCGVAVALYTLKMESKHLRLAHLLTHVYIRMNNFMTLKAIIYVQSNYSFYNENNEHTSQYYVIHCYSQGIPIVKSFAINIKCKYLIDNCIYINKDWFINNTK